MHAQDILELAVMVALVVEVHMLKVIAKANTCARVNLLDQIFRG